MTLSRRKFLKLSTLAATAMAASSCSVIGNELAQRDLPEEIPLPASAPAGSPITDAAAGVPQITVDVGLRFLNRAGYGPRPGDLERLNEIGYEAYVEEQLNFESIEDNAAYLFDRSLTTDGMDISQLADFERRDIVVDLIGGTLMRALISKRQLYTVMVEFWSDHFNIFLGKNQRMPALKLVDDRDVIQPHALGKFRDLLWASAQSPAMLVYLDNIRNGKEAPNENYARELMELHTLGVHAGYTQEDVETLARILTGVHVGRRGLNEGQFVFNEQAHDTRAKQFLGETLPAGQGIEDLYQALEILASHPATATFIATKLVRRFVADDPPESLIADVAQTFTDTDGDIRAMLRVIFFSDEFATAPAKLKRPFTFLISTLRALHTNINRFSPDLGRWLEQMGQPLFQWPPPNGYPDVSPAWAGSLLPRWNFSLELISGNIRGLNVPFDNLLAAGNVEATEDILNLFAGIVHGTALSGEDLALLSDYVGDGTVDQTETLTSIKETVALMLCSPAFQWV